MTFIITTKTGFVAGFVAIGYYFHIFRHRSKGGEMGVYKRGNTWQAIVRIKGHETVAHTFDTKAQAEEWHEETRFEIRRGRYFSRKEVENTTLAEALDRYEREILPSKKSQRPVRVVIRQWLAHPLAKRALVSIRGSDIAAWRDHRLKTLSPNTVRLDLALLSHLFTIAIKEWGMTGLVNPVQQIRKPKLPKGRDRRLNPGELDRIVKASCSPLLPEIIRFALETAMRRGEITGMTWKLVDLKKRTATLLDTKNGEKRIVPLSLEAVRILSGIPRRIDGQVWGLEDQSVTRAFERAVSRARAVYKKECEEKKGNPDPSFLVDITFHDLRHEATSRFFELGFDATKVKEITGHKTYSMLSRYTHLKAEDIAIEMDRLEKRKVEDLSEKLK